MGEKENRKKNMEINLDFFNFFSRIIFGLFGLILFSISIYLKLINKKNKQIFFY